MTSKTEIETPSYDSHATMYKGCQRVSSNSLTTLQIKLMANEFLVSGNVEEEVGV